MKCMRIKQGQPLLEELGRSSLLTDFGDWTYIVFGDYSNGAHHEMLKFGDVARGSLCDGKDLLVRFHSSRRTNEA